MKRCIPLLLIVALICAYIPVTASAAYVDEEGSLNVSIQHVYNSGGYNYVPYDNSDSLYISNSYGFDIRSVCNDKYFAAGDAEEDDYIFIEGEIKKYTFSSGWIIERGGPNYLSMGSSPFVCRTIVSCYDTNKTFLCHVVNDMPIPTVEDIYTTSSTVYGLQCPSATAYVVLRSVIGCPIQLDSNTVTGNPYSSYADFSAPYHTFTSFYSIKTPSGSYYSSSYPEEDSDIQTSWVDSSFGGETIYTEDDQVNLMLLAYGYNVNLTAEFKTYNEDGDLLDTTSGSFIRDSANNYQYIELRKWVYGYRTIICNVYYESSLIDSFSCIAMPASYDGSGSSGSSGDSSLVLEKIEFLDTELQEVQEGIYGVSSQIDELPDQIESMMQDMQDQEKEQASQQGQSAADEIIEIIPDESENFYQALQGLIDILSYDGTAAVITMPAIKIPAVSDLFPEIEILPEQEIDFSYYIDEFIPDWIMSLVKAFFDIAIVYYCLKELSDLIGSFSNGFSNMISINGGLE